MTTFTSGRARSSQPVMPSGLPGRTTSTTTDLVTMPLWAPFFQSWETRPLSTRRVMSDDSEKCTKSAGSPLATLRLCSPDAPKEVCTFTPEPPGVVPHSAARPRSASESTAKPTMVSWPARVPAEAMLEQPASAEAPSAEAPTTALTPSRKRRRLTGRGPGLPDACAAPRGTAVGNREVIDRGSLVGGGRMVSRHHPQPEAAQPDQVVGNPVVGPELVPVVSQSMGSCDMGMLVTWLRHSPGALGLA